MKLFVGMGRAHVGNDTSLRRFKLEIAKILWFAIGQPCVYFEGQPNDAGAS